MGTNIKTWHSNSSHLSVIQKLLCKKRNERTWRSMTCLLGSHFSFDPVGPCFKKHPETSDHKWPAQNQHSHHLEKKKYPDASWVMGSDLPALRCKWTCMPRCGELSFRSDLWQPFTQNLCLCSISCSSLNTIQPGDPKPKLNCSTKGEKYDASLFYCILLHLSASSVFILFS